MIACNNHNMRNPIFTDVGIWGYTCYDCCMLSSPAFVCMHAELWPCFYTFWHFHPYILQHFSKNVFTLVSLVFTVCTNVYKPTGFRSTSLAYLWRQPAIGSDSYILSCTNIAHWVKLRVQLWQQLVVQRNGHKGATLVAKQRDKSQPRPNF